jgi:ketosteroid isomerase-like protein
MLRTGSVWLGALWIGLLLHLDWHLGRPGHDHASFDMQHHWLLAIPAFVPIAWLALRNWPAHALRGALIITGLGVALGQVVEPLGESLLYRVGMEPFTNGVRWRIFAQFLGAGLVVLYFSLLWLRRLEQQRDRATLLVIEHFNDAFNRHDVDAIMASMTDDCVFENTRPAPDGERVEGQARVRAVWEEFFRRSPKAIFEAEEMFAAGDRCVVRWVYHWVRDGVPGHVRGVDIFRIRDGRVAAKLSYVKG